MDSKEEKMYVDPGAGNIIIQVLIGVAVALPVMIKVFWTKIKTLGRKTDENA